MLGSVYGVKRFTDGWAKISRMTKRLKRTCGSLGFETSLFVASYDLQGYGGGIRPYLHTGLALSNSSGKLLPLSNFERTE
jgi:hypothetical protein